MPEPTLVKVVKWKLFSRTVSSHIIDYVVPQYGDTGNDECSDYTVEDIIKQIKKYAARNGKNSRVGQEKLDLIKIAHYAQMAYELIETQEEDNANRP